jgi:hypothetical protein
MWSPRHRIILAWITKLIAAAILGMAGVSKLAGAEDSVALFTLLGAEPLGRLLLGVVELAATALLLWPARAVAGAMVGVVLMVGAIGTHLTRIGINYGGDPSLFIMACVTLAACAATIWLGRKA